MRTPRRFGPWRLWTACLLVAALATSSAVDAKAPHYCSYDREQQLDHTPNAEDLLRIWVVYVGQGDGLLVELPPRLSYASDDGETERLEVLVDAGAYRRSDRTKMTDFLRRLYPDGVPVLEHVVVSHHDMDHVLGITELLEQPDVAVETLYHNGLASYLAGKGEFRATEKPASGTAVYKWSSSKDELSRGMAFLKTDDSGELQTDYLVVDREDLAADHQAGLFQGLYHDLADALLSKQSPQPVGDVVRLTEGAGFVTQREQGRVPAIADPNGVDFQVLWPPETPRKFGDWGETINGNSVTFRLTYGEFEMLFTGDHNERSEEEMLEHLEAQGRLDELASDVLKIPHHGSRHGIETFFREGARPVVSVVSLGRKGFRSKEMGSHAWQHPSTDVIRWLGGAHRVYRTLIHEKYFDWDELDSWEDHEEMVESSLVDGRTVDGTHVLIETDGTWFRLVEVPIGSDLSNLPTPRDVHRGDGTRWIRARPTPGGTSCSRP